MAGQRAGNSSLLRPILICGILTVLGYVGLFCLMQTPAMWYYVPDDPVRSLFPGISRNVDLIFPITWLKLNSAQDFALVLVPLFLAMLALIIGPLLYLLKRLPLVIWPHRASRGPILGVVFGVMAVVMLVLLFQRGLFSSDIYAYEWYSRLWVQYGASPYTHLPVEYAALDTEGSLRWDFWKTQTEVYGPLWVFISGVFYKLGQVLGGSFSAQLLSLRLLADIAHLFNAWLIWCIAGLVLDRRKPIPGYSAGRRYRIAALPATLRYRKDKLRIVDRDPGRGGVGVQVAALLFYAWNPVTLVEFAGSGHNDVVMLTFVLLAFWLYLKGWWHLAALALSGAIMVKLFAALFLPGFLWLLLWDGAGVSRGRTIVLRLMSGAWRGLRALALLVFASVVLYIPLWEGIRTLQPLIATPSNRIYLHTLAAAIVTNAPYLLAKILAMPGDRAQFTVTVAQFLDANVRFAFFILLVLLASVVTWRARTFSQALTVWGWVALIIILTQALAWPWYVSWAVVPAALSSSPRLRNATLIFAVSFLLHYIEELVLSAKLALFTDWSGALIMMPPLLYLSFAWLSDRWRDRQLRSSFLSHARHIFTAAQKAT